MTFEVARQHRLKLLKRFPFEKGIPLARYDAAIELMLRLRNVGGLPFDFEPVERVSADGQKIGQLSDRRKGRLSKQLGRNLAAKTRKVEFCALSEPRKVRDHHDRFILEG